MQLGAVSLCAGLAACSVPGLWVYEGPGQGATASAGAAADPTAYADAAWSTKVVPTIASKAVDASTLLPAISADATAAGAKYGIPSTTGGAPTFMVKGKGKVTKVDTSDPHGPITVDLGAAGTITIATGPVITGTALRDAAGITFGEFTNQIDYQNVGTALNNKSKTEVIAKVDVETLKGKTLTFTGAFAASSADDILVVPTELTAS